MAAGRVASGHHQRVSLRSADRLPDLWESIGLPPENARFGIGKRVMVDNQDKSLPQEVFDRVVIGTEK